jgi:5-methylcytosine-specific restriction enzyme A
VLCSKTATVADHFPESRRALVAKGVNDPDAFSRLRPLCTSCRNKETAKHQPGGWAAERVRPRRS